MLTKTIDYPFYRIYELVALVEECVYEQLHFEEINWENSTVLQRLYEFSKITLLHYYIYGVVSVEMRRNYRKNADSYEEEEITQIEDLFNVYQIDIVNFNQFASTNYQASSELPELAEIFFNWFETEEDKFEQLWEIVTEEIFHLLFFNRRFLMNFNLSLAEYLRDGNVIIPTEYLDDKGVLKRQSIIPSWAKKAVYCRDQGRCVLCQKDLSGLLSTDRQIHYDHIVPLKQWGVNDPCNLQLLCDECNLKKSGNKAQTTTKYSPWWKYDDK